MKPRTDVLLWAQRVVARRGQPAHVLLEIAEDASPDEIQAAFHKIARASHPDLHRQLLDAAELELVTSAYAAVAGAYQEMRIKSAAAARAPRAVEPTPPSGQPAAALARPISPPRGTRAVSPSTPPPIAEAAAATAPARPARSASPSTPPPIAATATATPISTSAPSMSPKAVIYYRKAETCLKRGDLKGAVLQLKLAIAQDPTSSFLRTALAEVESEARKAT